ncbi:MULTISPECIES: serine hydrolase domain-containing protein [unclassified Rhodococcus (in: high G+C Gram-positive bacteria)]|uniref:serine hydrolase domain-containing protein n=1 Tax=unclassified Rhodococcus (in: high G+C Gram-positive bacteria) TaxID=192944 RepID=UPI0018CD145E|nr:MULTISPECIES: serine hydrolase domain-containing protein [unclassified Rhodococcus (in: high G+C Gram-positive bacteria)]MBH0120467.1 beta-lactamase family protein [Rhodococcus sp. CX]MCK8674083.1 beta-lactamase family protein [Rhodococcus sp. HM1]
MRRLPIFLAATVVALASACTSDDTTTSPTTGTESPESAESALADRLQETLDSLHGEIGFPGVVARVIGPEGEWTGTAGVAGVDTQQPPTPEDHTRVGSLTKTMTATAILQLWEDGRLELTDPIGKYVPGLPNGDIATLEQVATMTSGIPSYTFDEGFQQQLFANPDAPWTPEQLLDVVRGDPPNFAPGEQFEYSNSNYVALGLVVEQVSGQSLADYFEEHLFAPLGMSETSLPADAAFPDPHLAGITEQGQPEGETADATNWNPSWGWAAGAVISSIDDLQRWAKALGTGEGILNPETQQYRLESFNYDVPPATPERAYGFGWGIENGWLEHTGELPGYNTYAGYLPASGTILVAAVNSDIPAADGTAPVTVVVNALKEDLR